MARSISQFSPVYGGICFVHNLIGAVRDKDVRETSYPLMTHEDRVQYGHKYQIERMAEMYLQNTTLPFSIPFLPLTFFLPSLPKMSYSKCLFINQVRGDPSVEMNACHGLSE